MRELPHEFRIASNQDSSCSHKGKSNQDLRTQDGDSAAEQQGPLTVGCEFVGPLRTKTGTEFGCCLVERNSGRITSKDCKFDEWTQAGLGIGEVAHISDVLPGFEEFQSRLAQPASEFAVSITSPNCAKLRMLVELLEFNGGEGKSILVRFFAEPAAEAEHAIDALTGLPDRRALAVRVAHERLREPFVPFAVMFVDIDQFKKVNDTLGHRAGDLVLVELARRWRAALRNDDLLCRYGGDEFVVVLGGVGQLAHVSQVLLRFEKAAAAPVVVEGESLTHTLSIGSVVSQSPSKSLDDLIHEADQEMYKSKQQRLPH